MFKNFTGFHLVESLHQSNFDKFFHPSKVVIKTYEAFFVAFVTLLLWNLPSSAFGIDGLNIVQQRIIAIFAFATLMWIFEIVPSWATSVAIIGGLLLFTSDSGIKWICDEERVGTLLSYKSIMATFADPVIMLFIGGFILAIAATKTGLDALLAKVLLKPFGKKSNNVLLGFLLITGLFSMFVSNTATAAMMLTFLTPVFRQLPPEGKGRISLALSILANYYIIELNIEGEMKKDKKTYIVIVTFIVTVLLWLLDSVTGINSYTVALIPFVVFSLCGIIDRRDLEEINWSVIWMVAGGFALGYALNASGLAELSVKNIPFAQFPPILILLLSGLVCYGLSNFISNSATAALLMPILTVVCAAMGDKLDAIGGTSTVLIGVAIAASSAMVLPISTPPNALAYATNLVEQKDMSKIGLMVGVLSITLGYVVLFVLGSIHFI